MLIFSEKRFYPIAFNIVTHECKKGGYLYVGDSVFGSAYALQDRYGKLESYLALFGITPTAEQKQAYNTFLENVLEPMDMLAPFVLLVNDFTEEDSKDFAHIVGMLHKITTSINVTSFINSPKEVRTGVKFYSRKEYKTGWELIMKEWISEEGYNKIVDSFQKEVTQREIPEITPWEEIVRVQNAAIPKLLEQAKVQELLADWQTSRMRMELDIEKYKETKGTPAQPPSIQFLMIPGMMPNQTAYPQGMPMGYPGYEQNNVSTGGNEMYKNDSEQEKPNSSDSPILEEKDGIITYFEDDEDDAEDEFGSMLDALTNPSVSAPPLNDSPKEEKEQAPTPASPLDRLTRLSNNL